MLSKKSLIKILTSYIVISLVLPLNLLFVLEANAQTQNFVVDNPLSQTNDTDTEVTPPNFSVTPKVPPKNSDTPPPSLKKEPKTGLNTEKKDPKSTQVVGNNNSPRSGEPEIDSYKYAVANNASKADVNGMTGAFSYSINLYTPPGRNGMEPSLSLNYSSQTKSELNWAGYGWNIDIPYIQRHNKTGVYQDGDNNLYTANTFTSSLDGELATTSTTGLFYAKSDNGSFLNSVFDSSTNKWTVEAKDGTVYKFGHSQDAQIYNSATTTEVYKWMLEEVRDLNGNYITYEYYQDAGYIYPETIYYTNDATSTGIFTVDFSLEERQDTATSTEAGFPMTSNYRINQITVSVNGEWVRKYNLEYTTGDNGRRSLLQSVTESAQKEDRSSSAELPATTFSYQESTPGWTATTSVFALPEKFKNIDDEDTGLRIADVNGDALPDLIRSQEGMANPKIWVNDGSEWNLDENLVFPDHFVDNEGIDLGTRLIDVNGDGLIDVLRGNNAWRRTFLHNGTGWSLSQFWVLPKIVEGYFGEKGYRFTDINGDGLIDMLHSVWDFDYVSELQELTQLNNGYDDWGNENQWTIPTAFLEYYGDFLIHNTLGIFVEDINADGLPDILSKDERQPWPGVFLNNGRGGWDKMSDGFWDIPTEEIRIGHNMVDVNNDGLVDFIDGYSDGDNYSGDRDVYINDGLNFNLSTTWKAPETAFPHYGENLGSTQISDINGDGTPDMIQRDEDIHNRWLNNNSKPVDVLINIEESAGGIVDVVYKSSAKYRDSNEDLLNPNLPFVVQATESVTVGDGFGNIASEDTYEYSSGLFSFLGGFDKGFVGFGKVEKTDAEGNVSKTYFHQGNETASTTGEYQDHISKVGKPYRVEVYNDQEDLYSKTINKWESFDRGGENYFVKLVDSVEFTYDGDSDHKEKAIRVSYDNSSGNTTTQINFGKVSGNDDGTFSDIGTDEFITSLSYATSTATSTITKLSQEITTDNSGNKTREKKIYYDGLSFGNLNKGNSTKSEQWVSGSSYIDTERTFNSYGLVTQEKDPKDKATSYTYDDYNLYPATTTNALSQTIEKYYDYSSGQVNNLIDPNGQTYQTIYDAFDRINTEKQPSSGLVSSGFGPTQGSSLETKTKYVYTDNIFPRKVKKTDYLGSTLTVDSYFYFDGLNRKVEKRIEAEDSNTFKIRDFYYNSRGLLENRSLPFFSPGTDYTGTSTIPESYLITEYTYDTLGRTTNIQNSLGSTINTYDDWKVTTTDAEGNSKEFTKDAQGNLVEVIENEDTNQYTTSYEWNGNKNLTKITDAEGNVRNFTYDGLGRRLTAEDLHDSSDGTYGTWTYTYDNSSNLASSTDPKNQTTNFTYDDLNRVLTEDYTGSLGTEMEYGYDNCTKGIGRLCVATSTDSTYKVNYNVLGFPADETKTIDSTDYVTEYSYNRQGDITNVTYPDNSQVKYTFNTAGLLEVIQKKEQGGSWVSVVTDIDYSPTDQVMYKVFNNGVQSAYVYDPYVLYRLLSIHSTSTIQEIRGERRGDRDNLLSLSNVHEDIVKEKNKIPFVERFNSNRLLGHRYLEDDIVQYAYKTNTKIDEVPASSQILNQANKDNLKIIAEIPSERTKYSRTFATDKKNIFISEIISGVPQYYQDSEKVWWQANYATTTLEKFNDYGGANNRSESTFYPEPNPENSTVDGVVLQTNTPGFEKIWSEMREAGGTTAYDYNYEDAQIIVEASHITNKWKNIGRAIRLFNTSSLPNEAYVWNATYNESTQAKGYNDFNCKINIYSSNPVLNTRLTPGDFDSLGGDEEHGEPFSVSKTMSNMPASEGSYSTWELDPSGLEHIDKAGITKFGVRESKYDGANMEPVWDSGKFCQFIFNNSEEDGTSKDPKLVVIYESYLDPNNLQLIYFNYDNVGNIVEILDNSATKTAKNITFEYDDLYRLTTASTTVATSTPFRETYTYNSIGNITNKSDQGTYTYNDDGYNNPHAADSINSVDLSYDNNGNLTSYGSNSYTWDWRNRMTDTTQNGNTTNYFYDHTEQRVKKTTGGAGATTTIFPNKYFDKTGATSTKHIYDDKGGLIATVEGSGAEAKTHYIHTDHLGGTNVVTDESGEIVEVTDYLPFGKINTHETTTNFKEPRKYTSHIYDEESDLNYMNARYQDGEIGRFLSQDSVASRFDPSSAEGQAMMLDPQLQNTYSYAANNPLKYTDPDGEFVQIAIGALVGSAASGLTTAISGGNLRQTGAALAGGAIAGAAFAAAGPAGLLETTAAGAVSNVTGSSLARGLSGDEVNAGTVLTDAAVGGVGGALGYGVNKVIGGIGNTLTKGITNSRLNNLNNLEVDRGAQSKLNNLSSQLGTSRSEILQHASQNGQRYVDLRNNGNINILLEKPNSSGMIRITTDPTGNKIISAGRIQRNSVYRYISRGQFKEI